MAASAVDESAQVPRSFAPVRSRSARLVVLVSGSGTNLQALLEACARPSYGARVVSVGADRPDIEALVRAERAGVDTFVCRLADHPTRAQWDVGLADRIAAYQPDLVVLAGFMKLTSNNVSALLAVCTEENCPASTSLLGVSATMSPTPSVGLPKRPKVLGVGSSNTAKLMKLALKLPLNT